MNVEYVFCQRLLNSSAATQFAGYPYRKNPVQQKEIYVFNLFHFNTIELIICNQSANQPASRPATQSLYIHIWLYCVTDTQLASVHIGLIEIMRNI